MAMFGSSWLEDTDWDGAMVPSSWKEDSLDECEYPYLDPEEDEEDEEEE